MARTIQTRKRSRNVAPFKRAFKRRRIVRRGGRKTNAFTSQSGGGGGLRFKARKISRRRWNNMLWNNTLQQTHYRSNVSGVTTLNTPASTNTQNVLIFSGVRLAGNPFYTTAGGAIAPDAAQALPVFTGNVVVRGGIMGCRIANNFDTVDAQRSTIMGTVMLINSSKNYSFAAVPSNVYTGWDPSLIQDFSTTIGRILYRKNFLLRDADTAVVEYRHKIKKYDVGDYVNERNEYLWLVFVGNVDVAAARAVTITSYYNLSFAADGV